MTLTVAGTTFPGGHVEQNEIFQKSMIREVWEETGLTIETPKLCGLYHWHKGGVHYVITLYRADGRMPFGVCIAGFLFCCWVKRGCAAVRADMESAPTTIRETGVLHLRFFRVGAVQFLFDFLENGMFGVVRVAADLTACGAGVAAAAQPPCNVASVGIVAGAHADFKTAVQHGFPLRGHL